MEMTIKSRKIAAKKASSNGMAFKGFSAKDAAVVDESKRIVEVKFASFGNVDSDGDLLVKGCFAKSIQERGPGAATNRKIAFVWQHDIKDPIGKILSIDEREDGAYASVQLSNFDAVPNAKRAYYQLQDGDINQFSFGFEYIWDKLDYDEALDAFIVKEVKLYEISPVTLGANEMTEFIGIAEDAADLKGIIKGIAQKDKEKFNEIKQYVNELEREAEPVRPLTSGKGLFDKIANSIN